ncbi:hypothetical protein CANINC_004494 [Pichia inconspicua]|uniref:Hpc2-related domain-containing protein n=1 Tax=Pichia inconspicua TaxID=52247 RepID=A0A4T0WVF6_9ASCO|nr:hypothetical protein CANINC_004494 [[Candida] inconspicua]
MTENRSNRNIPISSLVTNGDTSDNQIDTIKAPQLSNSPHLSTILNPASELTPKAKVMTLSELMNEEEEVSMGNEDASEEDQDELAKEVPKEPIPAIINIEVPLSTHNDIHSEFIFSRLVEEKYGTDTQPTTINKSLWNYDADEDEDEEDGDDDAILEPETNDQQTVYDDEDEIVKSLKIKFAPGLSDIEKEKIVLNEIHKRKMENNKRIGKYDVYDPFIDDEELVYEEDFNANADGWYVWYGELEINNKRAKNPEMVESTKQQKQIRQGRTSNNSTNSNLAQSRAKPLIPPSPQGLSNGAKRGEDSSTTKLTPAKKRKVEEPKPINEDNDGKDKDKDNSSSSTEKHPALIIGSFGF